MLFNDTFSKPIDPFYYSNLLHYPWLFSNIFDERISVVRGKGALDEQTQPRVVNRS